MEKIATVWQSVTAVAGAIIVTTITVTVTLEVVAGAAVREGVRGSKTRSLNQVPGKGKGGPPTSKHEQRPREVKVFLGSVCLKGLRPPDQSSQWVQQYLLFQESEAMREQGKSYTMTRFYPWQLATGCPQNNSCDPDVFSAAPGGAASDWTITANEGETVVSNFSFDFLLTHFWKQVGPNELPLRRRQRKISDSSLDASQVSYSMPGVASTCTWHWPWPPEVQGNQNRKKSSNAASNKPGWFHILALAC